MRTELCLNVFKRMKGTPRPGDATRSVFFYLEELDLVPHVKTTAQLASSFYFLAIYIYVELSKELNYISKNRFSTAHKFILEIYQFAVVSNRVIKGSTAL